MSKSEAVRGLGKALSHATDDPNLSTYIVDIAFIVVVVIIGYEIIKFLVSLE
jgi:hypothetical protein